MSESEKARTSSETDALAPGQAGPQVFISHDSRDADLAEAFSKLLKSASAGIIKTFRSSDKKGADGIDFGDEWYKRLMAKLQSTSDVVCLFMGCARASPRASTAGTRRGGAGSGGLAELIGRPRRDAMGQPVPRA